MNHLTLPDLPIVTDSELLLGIDVGTTAVKVAAFTPEGVGGSPRTR